MPKMKVEFEGFDEVVKRLTKLDGNVKGTIEKALEKSNRIVREKAGAAMSPHNETYQTIKSLRSDTKVEWAGTVATMPVGFDISKGGLAHIFLMYGTPRMQKDQKLYNAFYGTGTKNEVAKIQEEIFYEEIRKLNG